MTYPVFVTLLGALFFGGRLTLWGFAALAISYSGIVFIFAAGATAKGDHVMLGIALVVGASFTYALYNLTARPLVASMGTRVFTSIAIMAACASVLLHFMAGRSLLQLATAPPRAIGLAAVMAVTSTVLPSFMISAALGMVRPQAVSNHQSGCNHRHRDGHPQRAVHGSGRGRDNARDRGRRALHLPRCPGPMRHFGDAAWHTGTKS